LVFELAFEPYAAYPSHHWCRSLSS